MTIDFEQKLEKYADLAVRIGVGLQPGQRLLVRAPIETAPLTRLIVQKAYLAGAALVEVLWGDDAIARARYLYAPRESFSELPTASADALLKGSERGDAVLSISGTDPNLLEDQDPDLVAKAQRAMQSYLLPFSRKIIGKEINWCVIAAPVASWAKRVFPGMDAQEAIAHLWDAIFSVCRADLPDPVAAWKTHVSELARRRAFLEKKQYATLRFRAPGTDLSVGMPEQQVWLGGVSHSKSREIPFIANLPTEEVFGAPHKDRVDGVVLSTKPLSHNGTLIENFTLTFEKGRVVAAEAEKNVEVLRKLIATDEGSARLGEVALVPNGSPISKSGLLFYNTLFDENASSHLALGRAYRVCIAGGGEMSDAAFAEAGGNESLIHVDFMIGSGQMDVDALRRDGGIEPLMRAGEWVE